MAYQHFFATAAAASYRSSSSSSSSSSTMTADLECCTARQQQLCTSDAAAAPGSPLEVPASPSVLLSPPPSPPSPRVDLRCCLKHVSGPVLQQQQQLSRQQQQQQQQQHLWQHEQMVVDALLESNCEGGGRTLLSPHQLHLQQQQQRMQEQQVEEMLRLRQLQMLQQPHHQQQLQQQQQQLLLQQQQLLLHQAASSKASGVSAEVLAQLLGSSSSPAAGPSTWGTRCSTPVSPRRAAAAAALEKEAVAAAAAAAAVAADKETHLKRCLQRFQQAAAAAAGPAPSTLPKGTLLRVQDGSKVQERAPAAAAAAAACSSFAAQHHSAEAGMDVCEQEEEQRQQQQQGPPRHSPGMSVLQPHVRWRCCCCGVSAAAAAGVAPAAAAAAKACKSVCVRGRNIVSCCSASHLPCCRLLTAAVAVAAAASAPAGMRKLRGVKSLSVYAGPTPLPPCHYRRLYDPEGPLQLSFPPLKGGRFPRAELRLWPRDVDRVISQNSSSRKVHRACWLSPLDPHCAFPVAMKFVDDANLRDGRSIKREIECHLYIYQRLSQLQRLKPYRRQGDAWPCAELYGYYLDKKNPGQSVLITRKLSGPDFFDVIRTEHNSAFNPRTAAVYEQHKLHWCCLAMERIAEYARLGIRHNDIKPDNIVLDFFSLPNSNERLLDVKLIDLGTASLHTAKDFTGGTSWYESPEQKMLEFYTKKQRNIEVARQVAIGLPSDAWGAGLSITEVLMGRRVVDVLRAPGGPGPLEFRGSEGWAVHPEVWVACARRALGLDREQQRFPICTEAARVVFDMLVKPEPTDRATVEEVIPHLRRFAEAGFLKAVRRYNAAGGGAPAAAVGVGTLAAAAAAAAGSTGSSNPPAAGVSPGAHTTSTRAGAGTATTAGGPAAAADAAAAAAAAAAGQCKHSGQVSDNPTRYTYSHRSISSNLLCNSSTLTVPAGGLSLSPCLREALGNGEETGPPQLEGAEGGA
ncbi:hypothetical protein Efla_001779 [Eimeria flavescens]